MKAHICPQPRFQMMMITLWTIVINNDTEKVTGMCKYNLKITSAGSGSWTYILRQWNPDEDMSFFFQDSENYRQLWNNC